MTRTGGLGGLGGGGTAITGGIVRGGLKIPRSGITLIGGKGLGGTTRLGGIGRGG